jgi:hypothetical protein
MARVNAHPRSCCAQQTGVYRMIGSNYLVVCLPEEEKTSIYARSDPNASPPRYLATWGLPS